MESLELKVCRESFFAVPAKRKENRETSKLKIKMKRDTSSLLEFGALGPEEIGCTYFIVTKRFAKSNIHGFYGQFFNNLIFSAKRISGGKAL